MPNSVFVVALGASNFTKVQTSLRQDLANWIDRHVRTFRLPLSLT